MDTRMMAALKPINTLLPAIVEVCKGGDDAAEGHKEKLHARGGIPGVFFSYVRCYYSWPCQTRISLITLGYLTNEGH